MTFGERLLSTRPMRRKMFALAGAAAAIAARPAFAQQECQIGLPPHEKGPLVFLDYDQAELDAAYSQPAYEPNFAQVIKRMASKSRGRPGVRLGAGIDERQRTQCATRTCWDWPLG